MIAVNAAHAENLPGARGCAPRGCQMGECGVLRGRCGSCENSGSRRTGSRQDSLSAERLGRLTPNGRLIRYSPLSRFVELEFLTMGIQGKKQLWATLRDLAGLGRRLPGVDFDQLIKRAEHQRAALDPVRIQVGLN